MSIWNVGDKARTVGGECTVMAISKHSTVAIQYTKDKDIEIVGFDELRPILSNEDIKAIEEMGELYQDGMGPDEFCEALYLARYRKQEEDVSENTPEDINDPSNWRVGDWLLCTGEDGIYITKGKCYQITSISKSGEIWIEDDEGRVMMILIYPKIFNFISVENEK